jgi:FkbM family methyltransferase
MADPDPNPWRAPIHWKLGVSLRKRTAALRRLLGRDRPDDYRRCRYYGADFRVKDAGIGREILLKRFEWGQIDRLLRICHSLRPAAFVDVGANVGTYTCIVGRAQAAPRLIAFEPDERNASHLATHVSLNNLDGAVELHRVAVGAILSEAVPFQQAAGNDGALSRIASHDTETTVPMRRLDDTVVIEGQPIAIKVDVEEYELNVLQGGERFFRSNWGYAQIESDHAAPLIARKHEFGWTADGHINIDHFFRKAPPSGHPG